MEMQDVFRYGLEAGQIPRILFKYTTIETLKKGLDIPSIYFSPSADFNDPFELKYKLDNNYTENDWYSFLRSQGLSSYKSAEKAKLIMGNPQKAYKTISDAIEEQMKNTGILCLTPHNDNILMWAHYANSHKGACIEYDLMADTAAFCFPKKVEYSDDYIKFNYLKEQERVTECIFHKSKAWSYEDEYRIVRPDHAGRIISINPQAIRSICFGCKCDDIEINEIREYINKKGWTHIQLKKAEIDDTAFKLHFQNI